MCSKGGGSPPVPNSASTAFQSTTTPAPFATPLYQDFLNRANTLSQTPFNPAMQGQVAALNPTQTAAGSAIYNYGSSFPILGQNISSLGMQAGNWDPAQVRAIESPYTEDVVNATQNWFNNQNAIQGNDLMSQAIRSGNAFGGDRAGAAQGVLAGQQQLAQAPVIAGLRQAGYTQALNEYNTLKQLGLAGAQTAMAGGQFGLQGLNAAMGWGSMQQAQQQREFDVAQQNAMMSSAYPFQTLNWYGAALGGIAPLLGAQTVGFNTPPEQSGLTAGLGAASAGIGLANAAFGSGTPASSGSSPEGQKRGGAVRRRARGGLVPVYVRHNGGIVPGLAYGGSADDEDDEHEPAGPPEQASDRAQSEDYRPPQVGLPPREKAPAWGSQIGQLKTGSKQTTPSTFPGMGSSGSTQPQQKSDLEQGLNLATKALPLMTGLFALSDPRTKTDIQPAGRSESGVPLWGFRYKGDPKSYPKVVGAMAKDPVRLANGGSDDVDVLSDEDPDPVTPGQQYAADATGRATWFNPRNERGGYTYRDDSGRDWTDYGAQRLREGAHASGLPSTTPGIATPGRGDLGNWFEVNVGGRKGYAQKTDIGPSGVVDLNAPLASRMGFAPENVSGRVYARDLGRTRPSEADGDSEDSAVQRAYGRYADKNEHEPAGLPAYSGNTGEPGSASTREPGDEDAAPSGGRAGPGARPTPDAGTGPVGRQIPGLKPPPTFAQRLANDPFWQFGTALMAKPGLKRYPLQGVGAAAQSMSAQQTQERNRILDEKPRIFDDGKQVHALMPDGSIIPTTLPSAEGLKHRQAQELEAQRQAGRLELQGGKPTKLEVLKDPYLGNVKVQRQQDGTFFNPATGDRYDKNGNFVEGSGAGAGPQPPAPQQPQQQPQQPPAQRSPTPPRQSELMPREDTQWPDKTAIAAQPPAVEQPPAEQKPEPPAAGTKQAEQPPAPAGSGAAGAAEALAGPLPPQDEDQGVKAMLAASSGGFKSPNKVDNRILRTMGGVSKDEFDGMALRYAHGDASVLTGIKNEYARGALKARALQYFTERGMTPEDANNAQLEYLSKKAGARTLGNIEARTTEALSKAASTAPLVIETSKLVPRTNFPDLNKVIEQYYARTGDPAVRNFGGAVETFANNYALALGGGSTVVAESAKRHARELLQTAWSHGQIESQVKFLQRELDRELAGVQEGRRRFLGQGQGGQGQPQQQQLSPEDKAAVDWARKNPQHPRSKEILQQNGLQ